MIEDAFDDLQTFLQAVRVRGIVGMFVMKTLTLPELCDWPGGQIEKDDWIRLFAALEVKTKTSKVNVNVCLAHLRQQ